MLKLGLIGDSAVHKYTVSGRVWELISVVIDKKLKLYVIPASTPYEVFAAFEEFRKDHSFVGFNIAPPWMDIVAARAEELEDPGDNLAINTVYKRRNLTVGANTGPLAAQLAVGEMSGCESVLVVGAGGAGLPIARYLHGLEKTAYLYDPSARGHRRPETVIRLVSLADVAQHTYDLIINATPLARYFFDQQVEAFTSPLDLETLDQISHKKTIVQETNYLPSDTLLLQMARHLGLQVVKGDQMLVFEAAESLRRYLGITLNESTIHMLIEEIGAHIAEHEIDILEH